LDGALVIPLAAEAQQPGRVFRIGVLGADSEPSRRRSCCGPIRWSN